MSHTTILPYTDAQVKRAYEAAQQTTIGFDEGDIREILRGFHEAGIEVNFPTARFYAAFNKIEGQWEVIDDLDACAIFFGSYAERHARDHAYHLNAQDTP